MSAQMPSHTFWKIIFQHFLQVHGFRIANRFPFLFILDIQREFEIVGAKIKVQFQINISKYRLIFAEDWVGKGGMEWLLKDS